MCYLCLKDDVFKNKQASNMELKLARAKHIKDTIAEAEGKTSEMCYIGDATIELLKKEQYELSRDL